MAIAIRDPRTPLPARFMAALVVAYALSPIDLIPDFIPIFGHLDDLILVPLGIWLTLRLIPPEVMADARVRAASAPPLAKNPWGVALILALWVGAGWLVWSLMR